MTEELLLENLHLLITPLYESLASFRVRFDLFQRLGPDFGEDTDVSGAQLQTQKLALVRDQLILDFFAADVIAVSSESGSKLLDLLHKLIVRWILECGCRHSGEVLSKV